MQDPLAVKVTSICGSVAPSTGHTANTDCVVVYFMLFIHS